MEQRSQQRAERLTLLVMVAPMAGQIMLLAMLLALRQWMFAAMIVPSLLGCMASLALARHAERHPPTAGAA